MKLKFIFHVHVNVHVNVFLPLSRNCFSTTPSCLWTTGRTASGLSVFNVELLTAFFASVFVDPWGLIHLTRWSQVFVWQEHRFCLRGLLLTSFDAFSKRISGQLISEQGELISCRGWMVSWRMEIYEWFPQLTDNKPMSLFQNSTFSSNCLRTQILKC